MPSKSSTQIISQVPMGSEWFFRNRGLMLLLVWIMEEILTFTRLIFEFERQRRIMRLSFIFQLIRIIVFIIVGGRLFVCEYKIVGKKRKFD